MMQGEDSTSWRRVAEETSQGVELGMADDAVNRTRNQAVQGDHPQATGHADCRPFVIQAGEKMAGLRAAGIEVPGAECGREAGAPVVITCGVHMRDPAVCREPPDPVANQRAALSRAVISDVPGDYDQVKVREVAAVPENLLERCKRVNTGFVEAARGDMSIRQVQDPVWHGRLRNYFQSTQAVDALRVTPRWWPTHASRSASHAMPLPGSISS
jgi:hypothetical protein